MSTIMPKGDGLRQAIKWLSEEIQLNPGTGKLQLVNDASIRFNLSPNEEKFLLDHYKKLQEQD